LTDIHPFRLGIGQQQCPGTNHAFLSHFDMIPQCSIDADKAGLPNFDTTPSADPTAPTTKASISTIRVTCERRAPKARRSASSRTLWATRIEKVLTLMSFQELSSFLFHS